MDDYCVAESPDVRHHIFGVSGFCECGRFVLNSSAQETQRPLGERKPRRPLWERKAIKAIMVELDVKYTTALREYNRRQEENNG